MVVLWWNTHLKQHISLGSAPHQATCDGAQQPQQAPNACPQHRATHRQVSSDGHACRMLSLLRPGWLAFAGRVGQSGLGLRSSCGCVNHLLSAPHLLVCEAPAGT